MKKLIILAIAAIAFQNVNAQNKNTDANYSKEVVSAQDIQIRDAYLNSEEYKNPKVGVLNPENNASKVKQHSSNTSQIVDGMKPDGTPAAMPIPKVAPTEAPINPSEAELRSRSRR